MSDQSFGASNRFSLFDRIKSIFSVSNGHQPAVELELEDFSFERSCLHMRKAATGGNYYLMAMFSNRYRDRDVHAAPHKGGEIVSDKAHKSYVSFLDQHPDLSPELWSLHIPGTARKNRAHWWDYDGAFVYAEFELMKEEAKGVADFVKLYEPGLSHGFYVFDYDVDNAVIEDYYSYEISILPLEMAANAWTTFDLIRKEFDMGKFDPERRAALVVLHGEAYVAGLETKSDEIRQHLDQLEIDTKNLKKEGAESPEAASDDVQEPNVDGEEVATEKTVLAALQTLHEAIGNDMKTLRDEILGRLEALEEGDEERVEAKALAMPKSLLLSWQPASVIGDEDTEVEYNSPLGRSRPKQTSRNTNHVLAGMFDREDDDE